MVTEFERRLNLVWSSPTFAIKLRPDGSAEVFQPKIIPRDDYEYLIAATMKLRNGRAADAVFIISDGGGQQVRVYIRAQEEWLTTDDPRLPDRLGVSREEIFPFDWRYRIPVANDIFHSVQEG